MPKSKESEVHQEDENNKKPTMTSEQRKARYRELLDQVEILRMQLNDYSAVQTKRDENEETGIETAEALEDIIGNANFLFNDSNMKERIKHTDEVLLDAKVVATASDVLLFITESIDCTLDTYEHVELARKINSQYLNSDDPDETDYTELTKIACSFLKQPPKVSFIFGEIGNPNIEHKPIKEKKPRTQRNKREEQAAKKQPEKVTEVNKEEDSVDDTVKFLQWALNKECEESNIEKLNYFEFIIDPNSFSTTIENMFHLSFLIRDGRAKMHTDKDGLIQVTPVSSHDARKAKKQGVLYQQCILSINIDEWRGLIQEFKIKKCFLSKWKVKWESRKKN